LIKEGITPEEATLRMEPNQPSELKPDQAVQVMNMVEQLEELDDVQTVYSNLLITDEALAAMEAAG
jgi:transcriptional/translational regulatory protein YebC/TACO1